ncbi:MAG: hypothetical protein J6N81_07715 [Treponema sp.]|nr:hypothetical protein [Treponema sp.]MBP3280734.1 hypothetical protein [Treponema sp.]
MRRNEKAISDSVGSNLGLFHSGESSFYTVKISASYQGESDEGEDQVAMTQDENGDWLVAELPL